MPVESVKSASAVIQVDADPAARAWLDSHPSSDPRVIAYEVHRCCGGGKICLVRLRSLSSGDDGDAYEMARLDDGGEILIDRRAVARLPSRFALTMRGLGPFRHLDLKLDAKEWGILLYD